MAGEVYRARTDVAAGELWKVPDSRLWVVDTGKERVLEPSSQVLVSKS